MYKYKIFNNIAEAGIRIFSDNNFILDEANPDALMLRSKVLSNENFNSLNTTRDKMTNRQNPVIIWE